MSKPTDDIHWATDSAYPVTGKPYDGTPTTSEPSGGDKDTGWDPGQKPGAQTMNWWMRGVARFVAWLAGLFDDNGRLLQLQEDIYQWVSATGGVLLNAVHDSSDFAIRCNGSLGQIQYVPQTFKVGDVIDQLAVYVMAADSGTDPSNQLVVQCTVLHGAGTAHPIGYTGTFGSGQIVVNPAASPAWQRVTLDISPPYTVAADTSFAWSAIWQNGTTGKVQSFGARVKTP